MSIEPKKSMIVVTSGLILLLFSLMFIMMNNSSQDYTIQYEDNDTSKFWDHLRYVLNINQNTDDDLINEKEKEPSKYDLLHGDVIMSELGDPVVRAELGRATWHLLHSITSRFPEEPTEEESDALTQFIFLTARLYPCGDCAKHFQRMLEKIPYSTKDRKGASKWICDIHNGANKFLKKEIFDCEKLPERWPCYKCEESNNSTRRFTENLKLENL
ncbi:FAD-dependent thiol oxidase [Piromyces finnis]|uniref:Sulfhydryl oxidase n=1 Tax=Piromyces finnis TaxID=1754191 RepID=A0A1Y1V3G4_9FUNG|nr:FAD-dependent thiol oxidase [Piromyces finnis]|eukprot:ORX45614.1 FAD-dependent thiol oxidase [Piromyces finnis]